MLTKLLCCCLAVGIVSAQDYQDFNSRPAPARIHTGGQADVKPTPIPILKQINRHNEDGSYTYGYEGADGSFKIETKLATGEVKGKYGYVDENGKVRVVEYGANKFGFQPSGEGITVAPPTLVDDSTDKNGQLIDYDDEGQQQPQQQQQPLPKYRPQPKQNRPQAIAPQPQYHYEQQQPQYAPAPVPQQHSQFPNADEVYAARPRPSRPDSDYAPQQTFIPTPQVQEPSYEAAIGRAYSRPQHQQQQQPQAYQAPRAGAHLSQLAHQSPQYQQQQPQPQQLERQPQPQQQQYARPSPSIQGRSTSVLDQLAKDFALPQGGSPALHDITYTYY